MKITQIVPLSRQAVEILRALKLLTGNGKLVFPGALDKEKPMSSTTLLYALYRFGYQGCMTGHGFRGLAPMILNENDFDDDHVDLQFAHMQRNKVSAAYNHAKYLKQCSNDAVVGRLSRCIACSGHTEISGLCILLRRCQDSSSAR